MAWIKLDIPTTVWTVIDEISDWFKTPWFYSWFTGVTFLPSSLPTTIWIAEAVPSTVWAKRTKPITVWASL